MAMLKHTFGRFLALSMVALLVLPALTGLAHATDKDKGTPVTIPGLPSHMKATRRPAPPSMDMGIPGLTPEQKQFLETVRADDRKLMSQNMKLIGQKRDALYTLLQDPKTTEAQAIAAQKELNHLTEASSVQRVKSLYKVKSKLNPEQFKVFIMNERSRRNQMGNAPHGPMDRSQFKKPEGHPAKKTT